MGSTTRLFTIASLALGTFACGAQPNEEETSLASASSGLAAAGNCSQRAQTIWATANEMAGLVPGIGSAAKLGIAISKSVRFARCQNSNGASQLTMDELRALITTISGQVVDEALRQRLVASAETLLRSLEPHQRALERVDELDAAQREVLADDLEELALQATFLESDTQQLNWPIIPVYAQFASFKLGLLQLALELRAPGPARDTLVERLALERQASIEILDTLELRYLDQSPVLTRETDPANQGEFEGPQRHYAIHTKVMDGAQTVLEEKWSCGSPKRCDNRNQRRREVFARARDKFRELRSKRMQVLDANYLAFKNALLNVQAPAFQLQSGSSDHRFAMSVAPGKLCMRAGAEDAFTAEICARDADSAGADLLWGFVPGTGQLYSLGQNVCLQADLEGALISAACESLVPAAPDADGNASPPSLQSWGRHPGGYIVHLATGLCLNLAEDVVMPRNAQVTTTPGVDVVLAPCDYGSVGYLEVQSYYRGGYGGAHAYMQTDDVGEDEWKVVLKTSTEGQVGADLSL